VARIVVAEANLSYARRISVIENGDGKLQTISHQRLRIEADPGRVDIRRSENDASDHNPRNRHTKRPIPSMMVDHHPYGVDRRIRRCGLRCRNPVPSRGQFTRGEINRSTLDAGATYVHTERDQASPPLPGTWSSSSAYSVVQLLETSGGITA